MIRQVISRINVWMLYALLGVPFFAIRATVATRWLHLEIAFYILSIVIGGYLAEKYGPPKECWKAWVVGGFFGVVGFNLAMIAGAWLASDPQKLAAPIHLELQHHWEEHGEFPSTLESLKFRLPITRYGSFHYEPAENSYHLRLGEYGVDAIEATWDCGPTQCDYYLES